MAAALFIVARKRLQLERLHLRITLATSLRHRRRRINKRLKGVVDVKHGFYQVCAEKW